MTTATKTPQINDLIVKRGKIIVLPVRHAFGGNFLRCLPNDDAAKIILFLRFSGQREPAGVNLSFFAFA